MINDFNQIILGNALELLTEVPSECVRTIHTSPPYNIGREYSGYHDSLPRKEYLEFIGEIIQGCYRILVKGGSFFWQTGYTQEENGFIYPLDHLTEKPFIDAGFKLKDRIIWRYFGGMSFKKKFTNKHETILWWTKPGAEAYFDVFPVREKSKEYDHRNNLYGRNPGNVWEVDRVAYGSTEQTSHIAVFPEEISDRIVLTTTKEGELCFDPFSGSGTLCKVAKSRARKYLGFEIIQAYYEDSIRRLSYQQVGEFFTVLSSVIKAWVFITEGTQLTARDIGTKLKDLIIRGDNKKYTELFGKRGLSAMKNFKDKPLDRNEKIHLWKTTDNYFSSEEYSSDPLRIIDTGFRQSYKLHKEFNGPMRFAMAWSWLTKFEELVKTQDGVLTQTIRALVNEEPGSYHVKGKATTLINNTKRIKESPEEKEKEVLGLFIP